VCPAAVKVLGICLQQQLAGIAAASLQVVGSAGNTQVMVTQCPDGGFAGVCPVLAEYEL